MTGKPARMGGASGYRFILLQRRLQDLHSLRLEAFAVERAIAEDSDLSLLGRLAASQQPAAPAAAGPRIPCCYPETLPSEVSDKRANFSQRVWQESCEPATYQGHAHTEPVRSLRRHARQSMSFALPTRSQSCLY